MEKSEMTGEVPFRLFTYSRDKRESSVDMNQVVGKKDILFVCLDTLRYDAAKEEELAGKTPMLNQYGPWERRQAPGILPGPPITPCLQVFCPAPMRLKT